MGHHHPRKKQLYHHYTNPLNPTKKLNSLPIYTKIVCIDGFIDLRNAINFYFLSNYYISEHI